MDKARLSKESNITFLQPNSADNILKEQKESNNSGNSERRGLSWWQPLSYLALSVHGVLLSVGEWAWNKAQSAVGQAYVSAQRRTSLVYESIKFKSNSTINEYQASVGSIRESLQGRLQTRYMGAFDKITSGYDRYRDNVNLAVIQTKLRMQLAANSVQFRSENLKVDTQKRWSERFDETIKQPFENFSGRLSYAKEKTTTRVLRYKDSLTASVNDNLDSITLKAKEYEDNIENKFPNLSVKLVRKNKSSSTSQDYPVYGTSRCRLGRVAEPAPFLLNRGSTSDDDRSVTSKKAP